MDKRIILVENPIEQSYEDISEQYFNKWVVIYQPDDRLISTIGTVVAYADAKDDLMIELINYLNETYGVGKGIVERFRKEDWCEGYIIGGVHQEIL